MLWSRVKLLLAIVMSIIFGPLKFLPRSSKSCDCLTFRVLKYLLSTFLLYAPHCHMPYSDVTIYIYIFAILHLSSTFYAYRFYDLSGRGGCWFVVYIRRFIYKFLNVCPFDYTDVVGSGKVGPVNQVNYTIWVAVVTPTDRPKSVRSRWLIELFVASCCHFALLTFLLM